MNAARGVGDALGSDFGRGGVGGAADRGGPVRVGVVLEGRGGGDRPLYQAKDRTYELVAAVLRDPISADRLSGEEADLVDTIVRVLTEVTRRWRLPEAVRAYRGQRSVDRVFRTEARVGRTIQPATFLSTSISRDVALQEFTVPPGPGGPALFEITVRAGTPALWLPPVGDPELAYQAELLLPRRTRLLVQAERAEAGILIFDCEVLL